VVSDDEKCKKSIGGKDMDAICFLFSEHVQINSNKLHCSSCMEPIMESK
jgi:hypothetical protein